MSDAPYPPEQPGQPLQRIRPVGSGLMDSPEAQAIAAAAGHPAEVAPGQAPQAQQAPLGAPAPVPGIPSGAVPGVPLSTPVPPAAPVGPVVMPAVQPAFQQPSPILAPPTGGGPADGTYAAAGVLSAEDVITGDPAAFAHLDGQVAVVVDKVQQALVASEMAGKLPEARFDPQLRAYLVGEIDRLALQFLLASRVPAGETRFVVAAVVNEIIGLGPLEPLWLDPNITEVIVNGPNETYVERSGKLLRARGVRFRSQEHLLEICQRILSPLNRKLDVKDPLADGRLPDGSRVNAVHTAVAPEGPLLTIRRFPQVNRTLADLVEIGAMSEEIASKLSWLVSNKATCLVVGGTGTGKLLPLGAPIPTPSGWTTMGQLGVGDWVIGRDGHPCQVTFLSDIEQEPTLYRLTFSDGQTVIADADHQWVVSDFNDRRLATSAAGVATGEVGERTVTTQVMVDAGIMRRPGLPSFAVRVPNAVQLPEVALPVDPYLFGEQLAGGAVRGATGSTGSTGRRIPVEYLRSSAEQRLMVLRGLMDAEGVISRSGICEVSFEQEELAVDVLSLVRSLGVKASITCGPAFGAGSDAEIRHRVTFTTALPVFGVRAKAERLPRTLRDTSRWLYITSIDPVPSEPGRCIQVDSTDSTYLVHDFVPTHNTTMLNALSAAIPLHERVITIEDSLELRLNPESHVAALEARPSDASGSNAVGIRALVKNALRMRPDRIIVGEIRDQAALDMLQACNTGHEGSMSTIHANGPNEAVSRLAVMVAQGGEIPADKVDWLVGSALDLILMIRRYKDGSRRVSGLYEVLEVENPGDQLRTVPIFEWHRSGEDENGKLLGEYKEINPVSDRLREKLALDFEPEFTWQDVLRLSGR
jgi:Flp pilus assembly CpaF family ATPase